MAGPRGRMGLRMAAPLGRHMGGRPEARMAGLQVGGILLRSNSAVLMLLQRTRSTCSS
jgi:hypothetical protein